MPPETGQTGYKGSEGLKVEGREATEAEKFRSDSTHAQELVTKMLSAVKEGKIKLPDGKEYTLPEDKRADLRTSLFGFIDTAVKLFDNDAKTSEAEIGLDEKEWGHLVSEINLEAQRYLDKDRHEGLEKTRLAIYAITVDSITAKKDALAVVIKNHQTYNLGDWRAISREIATVLGVDCTHFEDASMLKLGEKVQAIIVAKNEEYEVGEAGKIGWRTLNGLALTTGITEKTAPKKRALKSPTSVAAEPPVSATPQAEPAGPLGTFPTAPDDSTARSEAPPAAPPAEAKSKPSSKPLTAPDVSLPKERNPKFAAPLERAQAETALAQFSKEQRLQMLEALSKGPEMSEAQRIRLGQVAILRTALESVLSNVEESRTMGESILQMVWEKAETTDQRKDNINNMLRILDGAARVIQKDPSKTVDSLLTPEIKEGLVALKDREGSPGKAGVQYYRDLLFDRSGKLKEANTPEELHEQQKVLIAFLRQYRDIGTVRHLVEENLLREKFEAKREELTVDVKQRIKDTSTAKISRMVSADVLGQWQKGNPEKGEKGMTEDQIQNYIKMLVDADVERATNLYIGKLNGGNPFGDLQGKEKDFMSAYKNMLDTGDEWLTISDEKFNMIVDEILINAPLIIISGGVASAVRAGLSAGARALITTGRLARFGLAAGQGAEAVTATGRLGKTLMRAGQVGGMLAEGATFEAVHLGLQGKWLLNQPDWVKSVLWSSLTLGAFHASGKLAQRANAFLTKNITKVADKSLASGIQALALKGNIEAATMLVVGAAQHGATTGGLEDFDFVDQLLHAYISVGALKVSGSVVSPVVQVGMKKFAAGTVEAGKKIAGAAERTGTVVGEIQVRRRRAGETRAETKVAEREARVLAKEARQAEREAQRDAQKRERAERREQQGEAIRGKLENLTTSLRETFVELRSKVPTLAEAGAFVSKCAQFSKSLLTEYCNAVTGPARAAWEKANKAFSNLAEGMSGRLAAAGEGAGQLRTRFNDIVTEHNRQRQALLQERHAQEIQERRREALEERRRDQEQQERERARQERSEQKKREVEEGMRQLAEGKARAKAEREQKAREKAAEKEREHAERQARNEERLRELEREKAKQKAAKEAQEVKFEAVDEIVTNKLDNVKVVEGKNGKLAFGTDEGRGEKTVNEDAAVVNTEKNAFSSIDGMGGMGHGDKAARILAEEMQVGFREGASLETIHDRAHQRMNGETVDGRPGENVGNGGACYIAARILEGNRMEIAQAGDVKLIVIGRDGTVRFETVDQGIGNIVYNAVQGAKRGETTRSEITLQEGDRVLAASDGLFDNLTPQEVAGIVKGKPIGEAIKLLNDGAKSTMDNWRELKKQGIDAKPDNINIIIYDFQTAKPRESTTPHDRPGTEVKAEGPKTPEEQAKSFAQEMSGVPENLILESIINHKVQMDGLPGTQGAVEAYFLPTLGHGGLGIVREIFYRSADGKLERRLVKSAVDSRNVTNQESIANEAKVMRIVGGFGEHSNLMKGSDRVIRDGNNHEHVILELAGDTSGWVFTRSQGMNGPKLIFQIMDGVKFLHDNGVIHRDLKWENVMVDSATGNAKVIDFGTLSVANTKNGERQSGIPSALGELRDINQREKSLYGSVITTPSIFKDHPLGKRLHDAMNEKGEFDVAYDHIGVFKMILEIPYEAGANPNFDRMRQIAVEANSATNVETIYVKYAELQALRAQATP